MLIEKYLLASESHNLTKLGGTVIESVQKRQDSERRRSSTWQRRQNIYCGSFSVHDGSGKPAGKSG